MGLYNVVQPCLVNGLHYVRPTAQPIKVDDDAAAELVESGCLTPYQPGVVQVAPYERTEQDRQLGEGLVQFAETITGEDNAEVSDSEAETPIPRQRRPRRVSED